VKLVLAVAAEPIERVAADVAVVFFGDERPLRGAAGRADWRLCGRLSALLRDGRLRGQAGEAALVPSTGGLRARLCVALGLGERDGVDAARLRAVSRDAALRALGLDARSVALALPGAGGELGVAERAGHVLEGLLEARDEAMAAAGAPEALEVTWVAAAEERAPLLAALRSLVTARADPDLALRPPEPAPRRGPRAPRGRGELPSSERPLVK
jgi:Cytosol aminopeptidase family, N-terminal domain